MLRVSLSKTLLPIALLAAGLPLPLTASAQTGGPDRCPNGLVWREDYAGDHLCVTPAERRKANTGIEAPCPPDRAGPCKQAATAAGAKDAFLDVTGSRPFLIIAPSEFMAALEPLVAHKNATGMPAIAVSIPQLTAHFPGADDPEKIKRGIQYAHEHWDTQYVMLAGDPHWFPVRFIFFKNFSRAYPGHPNGPKLPVDGVYAPSDLYYANLYRHRIVRSRGIEVLPGPFDDWDANRNGYYNETDWADPTHPPPNPNPDRVDGYPDVVVARATAHSVADVTAYVNKIIRYETQHPQTSLFTFVADGNYPGAAGRIDPIVAQARLKNPSAFLLINKPDPNASSRWIANASPADVASKINSSIWVGYLGHGSIHSWDGSGFGRGLVKLTANNEALPVVFTDGCVTGRFAIEAPFDSEYVDVSGARHQFAPALGADPGNASVPAMLDKISGQSWGARCAGCTPLPLITPKPNPYDFDRGNGNFAYPWLFSYPKGGAIAYFGHIGVMIPLMAAELETYMLTRYVSGERNLGAIYLRAQREYWQHHIDDTGRVDGHSPSRLYLGFMVMFGDPTLRMR
jgi:hypothetical protein